MDTATSDIGAVEFTPSREGDSPVLPGLPAGSGPADEDIGTVTADGAHDTRRCHGAIIAGGGTAFGHSLEPVSFVPSLPIRRNGRLWKEACPAAGACIETLRATSHYDQAFWKPGTGYHALGRAKTRMRCLGSFGEPIAARNPDRQIAEIRIRAALMNRVNALGTAEIVRVA